MVREKFLFGAAIVTMGLVVLGNASAAHAQGIIDEWDSVKAPPAPVLKGVTIDPKTTALLVFDVNEGSCGPTTGPRCAASLPKMRAVLDKARADHLYIVFSSYPNMTPYVKDLPRLPDEPMINSHTDKFLGTDIDKMLKDHNIKTVIAIGISSNGTVLFTCAGATAHGYDVVVPVDAIAGPSAYADQNSVWALVNDNGLRGKVSLTSVDRIKF
jgi:nicotinamidase-related amidase